jgi:hypothetical protein
VSKKWELLAAAGRRDEALLLPAAGLEKLKK